MTAEILCVGTELLLGDIVNTNAAYIARSWPELELTCTIRPWWEIIRSG